MIFYIVIIGKAELSAFSTLIGQDLRRLEGPLQGTVCLLEGI